MIEFSSDMQRAPKIIVGSGWWCDNTSSAWEIGSSATHSPSFFALWLRQVRLCLMPMRIVVTDIASPIKPQRDSDASLIWVELDRNYGHPNDLRTGKINTRYCGFTRSVMNGAMYALCCDADYYIYVEQDCLLVGDNLLAHAIGDATEDIFLGAATVNGVGLNGGVAAPMLQQSLMVVKRAGLERFLEGILGSPWSDGDLPPEEIMARRLAPLGHLRIPYGRSRPIDFSRSHFYAHHLTDGELARAMKLVGVDSSTDENIRT
jgi:hypothetical protein